MPPRVTDAEPPHDLDTIGKRVRYILFIRQMGINDLDRLIGGGRGWSSRVVSDDRVPTLASAHKIARALRVPTDWLLGSKEMPPDPYASAYALRRHVESASMTHNKDIAEAILRWSVGGCVTSTRDGLKLDDDLSVLSVRDLCATAFVGTSALTVSSPDMDHLFNLREGYELFDLFAGNRAHPPTIEDLNAFLRFTAAALQEVGMRMLLGGANETRTTNALGRLPGWGVAVAAARAMYTAVPAAYFDKLADLHCSELQEVSVDAQFIGEITRAFYEARLRRGRQPAAGTGDESPDSVT